MYDIQLTKIAKKDAALLERAKLKKKAAGLIVIVRNNPFQNPPPYETMVGDKKGLLSRRINKKHRFVYEVLPNTEDKKDEHGEPYEGIVKINSMWTHYERI